MMISLKQLDLNIDKGMMSGAGVFAPRTLVIRTFVLFTYITIEFSSKLFCPNEVFRTKFVSKNSTRKNVQKLFARKKL